MRDKVDNDDELEGKKKRYRSAGNSSLPLTSVLADRKDMNRVKKLLEEGAGLKKQKTVIEQRLEEIKQELIVYAEANETNGFRNGLCGFEYRGYISRQSLSKTALVEAGVDPQIIANCIKPGEEYQDARFVSFDLE